MRRLLGITLLVALAGAGACTTAGAAQSVSVRLAEGHSLVGVVEITEGRPVVATVTVRDPAGLTVARVGPTPPDDTHDLTIAGLRPETTYAVDVVLTDPVGRTRSGGAEATLTTGSLPEGLPPLEVTTSDPSRMAAGYTLFNLVDISQPRQGEEPQPTDDGWLVAVDAEGEIVWYHRATHPIGDARMLPDGTILYEYNDTAARRIDLRGTVLGEWGSALLTGRLARDGFGRPIVGDDAVIVDVDSMHHEHGVLPNGNHVTLASELRTVEGFAEPLCGDDPATWDGSYDLIGDVVVEFEPRTGQVVKRWSLFDYFDPVSDPAAANVCGLPFDWVFPNWMYTDVAPDRRDWTHANSVVLDSGRNALLVSIRHLDAVVALRYADDADGPAGELLWVLGPDGTLPLEGDGELPRHQHAPEVQDDGTILLYDNGNLRPGTVQAGGEAPAYSRAVLYRVNDTAPDPARWSVEQLWEYRSEVDGQPAFAPFVGDADRLENGNVLITDGGLAGVIDDLSAQIVEVVPAAGPSGGEPVFTLRVGGDGSWIVYRAERIPTLTP